MKVKAKLREFVELDQSIRGLMSSPRDISVRFSYGLMRNQKFLKSILEPHRNLTIPPQKIYEYEAERLPIAEKFAERDENGNFKYMRPGGTNVPNNSYIIPEGKRAAFKKEIDALRGKYKDVLDEMDKRKKDLIEMEDMEIEVDLFGISINDFPKELPANLLKSLSILIFDTGGDEDRKESLPKPGSFAPKVNEEMRVVNKEDSSDPMPSTGDGDKVNNKESLPEDNSGDPGKRK